MQVIDKHPILAREGWFYISLTLFAAILTAIIFMNVFSGHSNRAPFAGIVKKVWYQPGLFVNAAFDKAALENERNAVWFQAEDGTDVASIQVAGLVARRILCYVSEGDTRQRGERYGYIRFGSRVDLFSSEDFSVSVALGNNVSSGTSILGRFA